MIQCIADPNSPACAYMGLAILFFVFSMFFGFFTKSIQNLEKSKKKLQTLTHQLVPTWVLQFWFFLVFFGFLNFFLGFWPKVLKTSRNPKKTKKQNCRP